MAPALAFLALLPTAPLHASVSEGVASYYGERFDGRRTASGARFDMHALTAAHRSLPFGTRVAVTNKANGRSVDVIINDRGPFVGGRSIDLSKAAAREIGMLGSGTAPVRLEVVARASSMRGTDLAMVASESERIMMDLF
jgi:rare lipoprotein A